MLQDNWPLFTPVLISLLEDGDAYVNVIALEILAVFLEKCPAKTLSSTGLGSLLEESVFPLLLHLPTLTAEEDSAKLMKPAYDALIIMASKRATISPIEGKSLLDRTIREGVLLAYSHASQYILIVQTLLRAASAAVGSLGISAVKHFKVRSFTTEAQLMISPKLTSHNRG